MNPELNLYRTNLVRQLLPAKMVEKNKPAFMKIQYEVSHFHWLNERGRIPWPFQLLCNKFYRFYNPASPDSQQTQLIPQFIITVHLVGRFNCQNLQFVSVMMEVRQTMLQIIVTLLLLQLCTSNPIFYESFDEPFEKRWIVSENEEYKGVWKHSKSEGHENFGLLVSEKAKKYAIVKQLDEQVNLKDGTIVLQYEARFQNGLECGGAYIKFLKPQDAEWTPKDFNNDSPYSIMFGPDKCGSTDKVHFIFKHKNPITGEYVEHHLLSPPFVPDDMLTHVYSAIIEPNNGLRILIDGLEKRKADFIGYDFDPAIIPSKTIPDPDDKKPEDWDERVEISDPDARKPDDWDEDAPVEIEDVDAVKPDGWLDDEPKEIDDPESSKPEDWVDEEDGEWEAPKIDNPKCATAPGCGEWKKPMKRNPAYMGKWHAPLIDNPNYKGTWKPQEIPNPNYFELEKPDFEPIAAIGIEIWTMQDGILFDNILIANDVKVSEFYREKLSKPKYEMEKEKEKAQDPPAGLSGFHKKIFDVLYKFADVPFLKSYRTKIIDVIEKGEKQPNVTVGILVSIFVVITTLLFRIIFVGKKTVHPPKAPTPPETSASVEKKEDEAESSIPEREEDEKEQEDGVTERPRRSRRET